MNIRLLLIPFLLVPLAAGAASVPDAASTTAVNTYVARAQVNITKPLPADLVALGGTVNVAAPVNGEVLAAGGTVTVTGGATGDVRVAGGKASVNGNVGGDVAAAGGAIHILATAHNIYAAGGSVDVEGTAGNATIYGANVFLSGTYFGNVTIIASNRLTIGNKTHIHGTLKYRAPEAVVTPPGAVIDGGVQYTGASAYVPTYQQAHRYAVIGLIVFFAVRLLAGIIVAGLLAGLFPIFSELIARRVLTRDPGAVARLLLIGGGIAVLTPILCLFLLISFVGAGLSILLIVLYALLALLAYAFAGIVLGAFLRYTLLYRIHGVRDLSWQDAVLGTVCIHFIGLIPYLGLPVIALLSLACAGALAYSAYMTAFALERESA